MRKRILTIALLLSSLIIGSGQAAPVPGIDVPILVENSDLIVVGRVGSIQTQGSTSTFSIAVDRVLKGNISSRTNATINVQLDGSRPENGFVVTRQYGIFFLRAASGVIYSATDQYYPSMPASPQGQPNTPASADPLVKVAGELTQVLATPAEILTDPYSGVQRLVNNVVLPDGRVLTGPIIQAQRVYKQAVMAIDTISFDITRTPLQSVASSGQSLGGLWGIKCLLSKGDLDYLDNIKPILMNPTPELAYTVEAIARAIEHLKSSEIVPTVSELLDSTDVEVRRAAAIALGNVATQPVIRPLATIALNDEDDVVRYQAIFGLARATGTFAPSIPEFEKDKAKYMAFWTSWASTNVK